MSEDFWLGLLIPAFVFWAYKNRNPITKLEDVCIIPHMDLKAGVPVDCNIDLRIRRPGSAYERLNTQVFLKVFFGTICWFMLFGWLLQCTYVFPVVMVLVFGGGIGWFSGYGCGRAKESYINGKRNV